MKRLLTLDPGNGCTGAALYERGELRAAWALAPDVDPGPCLACPLCRTGASCQHQVHRPALIIGQIIASVPELRQVDVCAIERPAYWKDTLDAAGLGLFILGRNGRFLADPASFAELVEQAPARGASKGKRKRGPVQGGLALFAHATGPGGTPAALHADDVDGILPGEVP